METTILQQHLNNILDNIAELRKLTGGMDYEAFRQNEQIKETAYSLLQEIGQAAFEIEQQKDDRLDLDFDLSILSNFRNARYNMEAEINHQNVWAIITSDLNHMGEQLEQSREYLRRTETT